MYSAKRSYICTYMPINTANCSREQLSLSLRLVDFVNFSNQAFGGFRIDIQLG